MDQETPRTRPRKDEFSTSVEKKKKIPASIKSVGGGVKRVKLPSEEKKHNRQVSQSVA